MSGYQPIGYIDAESRKDWKWNMITARRRVYSGRLRMNEWIDRRSHGRVNTSPIRAQNQRMLFQNQSVESQFVLIGHALLLTLKQEQQQIERPSANPMHTQTIRLPLRKAIICVKCRLRFPIYSAHNYHTK